MEHDRVASGTCAPVREPVRSPVGVPRCGQPSHSLSLAPALALALALWQRRDWMHAGPLSGEGNQVIRPRQQRPSLSLSLSLSLSIFRGCAASASLQRLRERNSPCLPQPEECGDVCWPVAAAAPCSGKHEGGEGIEGASACGEVAGSVQRRQGREASFHCMTRRSGEWIEL